MGGNGGYTGGKGHRLNPVLVRLRRSLKNSLAIVSPADRESRSHCPLLGTHPIPTDPIWGHSIQPSTPHHRHAVMSQVRFLELRQRRVLETGFAS